MERIVELDERVYKFFYTTEVGIEPTNAMHIGLAGQRLNHSAILSITQEKIKIYKVKEILNCLSGYLSTFSLKNEDVIVCQS